MTTLILSKSMVRGVAFRCCASDDVGLTDVELVTILGFPGLPDYPSCSFFLGIMLNSLLSLNVVSILRFSMFFSFHRWFFSGMVESISLWAFLFLIFLFSVLWV